MGRSRSRRSGARERAGVSCCDTHESKNDPEARLFKRSGAAEAGPSYVGHVITKNRHGLAVEAMVSESRQKAERAAALAILRKLPRPGWPPRGRTRLTRKSTSFRPCASRTSRRMWPSMRPRSTGRTGCGRRNASIRASRGISRNASWWNRCLPGSKRRRE